MKRKINVKGVEVVLFSQNKEDYISLTDIAKTKNNSDLLYEISGLLRVSVKWGPKKTKAGLGAGYSIRGPSPASSRIPIPVAIHLHYIGLGRVA